MVTFDDVLTEIGDFGPYQKRLYGLTVLSTVSFGSLLVHTVISLAEPKHRCALPGYENDSYEIHSDYQSLLINRTIPLVDGEYDECHVISGYVTYGDDNRPTNGTLALCDKWVYDSSVFYSTFLVEQNLVCDKAFYTSMAQSLFYGGMLIGTLLNGLASDKFGRKPIMYANMLLMLVSSVGLAFAPTYLVFTILNTILGGAVVGFFTVSFVMGMEIVGPPKRLLAGTIGNYMYIVGYMFLGAAAYLLRDWKYILLTISLPAVFFIPYWWFLPESPRWLLAKGRTEEAEVILKRIVKSNKSALPEKILHEISSPPEKDEGHVWLLFTNKTMCTRSLIICFVWFCFRLVFLGLVYNIGSLGGNFYLDFVLNGVVEIPAYLAINLLLDRAGRRLLLCVPTLAGGLACISTIFTTLIGEQDAYPVTLTLALMGRFGVSISFSVLYVYTAELFPTVVRNAGLGLSSLSGSLSGIIVPYLPRLGDIVGGSLGKSLPSIVIGGLCILSGLLALTLPETANKALSETIEDAVHLGRENGKSSSLKCKDTIIVQCVTKM